MNYQSENGLDVVSRISSVSKSKLTITTPRFYFQSLVDSAIAQDFIDEEKVNQLQTKLVELLAIKIDEYTKGESSSVRLEIAEMLMRSNLFTISHYLKSLPTPEIALEEIIQTSILELYRLGAEEIQKSITRAKKLHAKILDTLTQTYNETYNETVVDGIKGFFKLYDPTFEAFNIHITADYPTIHPITNLDGIEFILAYLKAIYHENQFCRLFDKTDIHLYLRGLHPQYEVLIINIFEPLLIGALACSFLDMDDSRLMISPFYLELLYTKLHTLSKNALYQLIKRTANSLLEKYQFKHISSKNYIMKSLPTITTKIYLAQKNDTLSQVIFIKASPTKDNKLSYHAAPKMNDELFREVLAELSECRYSSDRVALIMKEVKAIEDFEDFVEEAKLLKSEIKAIISKLSLMELAVLIDRHPTDLKFNLNLPTEQELLLVECLDEYKNSRTIETQKSINRLVNHISNH